MDKLVEGMHIESARKGDCTSIDWVDKYIIEMNDQGCTRIAWIGKELFDIHILEERPRELPILKENLDMNNMVVYTSLGETRKYTSLGETRK